ncbi:hypothetical protein DMENIID0001_135490 [Sergentomyia squamirostris]
MVTKCFSLVESVLFKNVLRSYGLRPILALQPNASYSTNSTNSNKPICRASQITATATIPDECLHSEATLKQFMSYFPGVIKDIQEAAAIVDPIENGKHVAKLLEYLAEGGRKHLGMVIPESYKVLVPDASEEDIRLSYKMGWFAEVMYDGLNMIDDLMDNSMTRRNKPCWWTLPENRVTISNDALIVNFSSLHIFNKYFSKHKQYQQIIELHIQSNFQAAVGQWMDVSLNFNSGKEFTIEYYKHHCFNVGLDIGAIFPMKLAMILAGYTDPEVINRAASFNSDIMYYYLVQDDFIDCFPPHPDLSMGTDIEKGRIRWLSVSFMERASKAQKEFFKHHYGKSDKESIEKIKELYIEVKLPELYHQYADEMFNNLMTCIEREPDEKLKKLFVKLMEPVKDSLRTGGMYW